MTPGEKIFRFRTLVAAALMIFAMCSYIARHPVQAQESNEVAPYKFADLPHGRIYKAIHQGCEIFIVENDVQLPGGNYGVLSYPQHSYAVATGRGCR